MHGATPVSTLCSRPRSLCGTDFRCKSKAVRREPSGKCGNSTLHQQAARVVQLKARVIRRRSIGQVRAQGCGWCCPPASWESRCVWLSGGLGSRRTAAGEVAGCLGREWHAAEPCRLEPMDFYQSVHQSLHEYHWGRPFATARTRATSVTRDDINCQAFLFVAWERYSSHANAAEAANRMLNNSAMGQIRRIMLQQMTAQSELEPGVPVSTKYSIFFAVISGISGAVLLGASAKKKQLKHRQPENKFGMNNTEK